MWINQEDIRSMLQFLAIGLLFRDFMREHQTGTTRKDFSRYEGRMHWNREISFKETDCCTCPNKLWDAPMGKKWKKPGDIRQLVLFNGCDKLGQNPGVALSERQQMEHGSFGTKAREGGQQIKTAFGVADFAVDPDGWHVGLKGLLGKVAKNFVVLLLWERLAYIRQKSIDI